MKKSKLIPIEVLRVEDKIFGSLNFLQIGLLALPLVAAVILLFFPPVGKLPLSKMVIIVLVFTLSGLLAMRIHERLVLHWLILIGRYNCRPKAYVRPTPPHKESRPQIQASRIAAEHLPLSDVRQFVPAPIWQESAISARYKPLKDRFNQKPKGQR